jgi:hypothetical protein
MRWHALNKANGQRDEYAKGLMTHSVCRVFTFNVCKWEAWRLPRERLGAFDTEAEAENACIADFRALYPKSPGSRTGDPNAKSVPGSPE